ncbi:MAG TPA: hypothetical protein VNA88_12925 [Candidatus Kapabacteria bacterium]|jgi:hypothetical protein|nr:hypothetical protein [Candidatus Kapabacteria bacterium]
MSNVRTLLAAPRWRPRVGALRALVVLAGLCAVGTVRAEVVEWTLVDQSLRARTTSALLRYYGIVRPDSLRIRYISANAPLATYRLRAERDGNDTAGQIVSISLGQLTLASTPAVRIALGEDLHRALVATRLDPRADRQVIGAGDLFAAVDWPEQHHALLALDRADYRLGQALAVFAMIGAPESNQFFWGDATARIGVATPSAEFAVLVPFAGGATPIGPLRARRLAPGYGAAITGRYGPLLGRIRFTAVSQDAERAISTIEQPYVHTLSTQACWLTTFSTRSGPFYLSAGVGYEEFRSVFGDSGEVATLERVRRISPVVDLAYETPGRNYRIAVGVADMALRGSVLVQLSRRLSVEARWVSNVALRDRSEFEHPFLFFLSPRISF